MKYIHFNTTVQINENENSWSSPHVTRHINFSMPLPLFDEKKFGALISDEIEQARIEFPAAVLEFARERADEAAKKEVEEAEKHLQEANF
jgi:hypothetical protein